jgi:hypothetical protein
MVWKVSALAQAILTLAPYNQDDARQRVSRRWHAIDSDKGR